MSFLKVCGICLLTLAAYLILKNVRCEIASLALIGGGLAVVLIYLPALGNVTKYIADLKIDSRLTECMAVMMKALGIAYLAGTTCDICKESGSSALAAKIETAAKIEMIALSLPYIIEIVGSAVRMAG